jgi:tRNA pseudouridine55 synthase
MPFDFKTGEIILINKPKDWTSFDVVNNIRIFLRKKINLGMIKIGHAGTLDPLASGLLILCTGMFTKRIEEFQEFEKEYTGTFVLGATTPSFDLEKEIDQTYDYLHITEEMVLATAKKFTGSFQQTPPIFSAKKINGKRAYRYAREDQDVFIEPKTITISSFEIQRIDLPNVDFKIVCSKGTYIRSIARDFGRELNSGAYLTNLCRTRIGSFGIDDAYTLEQWRELVQKQYDENKA